MVGKMLSYYGNNNILSVTTLMPTEDHETTHHGTYKPGEIVKLDSGSSEMGIRDFFGLTNTEDKQPTGLSIVLSDRRGSDFVTHAVCRNCGHEIDVFRPLYRVTAEEYAECPKCGTKQTENPSDVEDLTIYLRTQETIRNGGNDQHLLNLRLKDIGIPPLDIVAVRDRQSRYKYYELSKDKERLFPSG